MRWLFFRGQVNVLGAEPAVEAFVAMILEDRIVERGFHASALGRGDQRLVVRGQFATKHQTALIFGKLSKPCSVAKFLPPGLQRKVGLAIGDDGFGRVTVLDDQVAGVAGEPEILDLAVCARADRDHCEDVLKMVARQLAAVPASVFRARNDRQKMPELRVLQHAGKLPGEPKFAALIIALPDALEHMVLSIVCVSTGHSASPSSWCGPCDRICRR